MLFPVEVEPSIGRRIRYPSIGRRLQPMTMHRCGVCTEMYDIDLGHVCPRQRPFPGDPHLGDLRTCGVCDLTVDPAFGHTCLGAPEPPPSPLTTLTKMHTEEEQRRTLQAIADAQPFMEADPEEERQRRIEQERSRHMVSLRRRDPQETIDLLTQRLIEAMSLVGDLTDENARLRKKNRTGKRRAQRLVRRHLDAHQLLNRCLGALYQHDENLHAAVLAYLMDEEV